MTAYIQQPVNNGRYLFTISDLEVTIAKSHLSHTFDNRSILRDIDSNDEYAYNKYTSPSVYQLRKG